MIFAVVVLSITANPRLSFRIAFIVSSTLDLSGLIYMISARRRAECLFRQSVFVSPNIYSVILLAVSGDGPLSPIALRPQSGISSKAGEYLISGMLSGA